MAVTRKDIDTTFGRVVAVARRLGYNNVDSWYVQCAYGNKYWLYETTPGTTGVSGLFTADGFLGTGTKDVHQALWIIARTLEDVEYRTDGTTRPERKLSRLSRYEGP